MNEDGSAPQPTRKSVDGGTVNTLLQWLFVLFCIYILISAVGAIGLGFKSFTSVSDARQLFEQFASNPFMGLVIGILATSLMQSSSSVTSVIVGLVAGGFSVSAAVPMVMGANIGTTITNTIVALGNAHQRISFRRAFAAATVHDFFNLIAVLIFLPLEMIFGILEKIGRSLSAFLISDTGAAADATAEKSTNFIKAATKPIGEFLFDLASMIYAPAAGIIVIIIAVIMIISSITLLGKFLKKLMVGRARKIMNTAVGRGPVSGIASGSLITILVQSSSTTTSLMVPMAASGVFKLKQIYPFTLGANIGTCITSLLAATAVLENASQAMQIAMVHFAFNTLAVIVIFGLPFLRGLPLKGAMWLANIATTRKIIAISYVLGVYFAVPVLLIFIAEWFG